MDRLMPAATLATLAGVLLLAAAAVLNHGGFLSRLQVASAENHGGFAADLNACKKEMREARWQNRTVDHFVGIECGPRHYFQGLDVLEHHLEEHNLEKLSCLEKMDILKHGGNVAMGLYDEDLRACVECKSGTFSNDASKTGGCPSCPAGYFQLHRGKNRCKHCPRGMECPDPALSPTECPPGTMQDGHNSVTCIPCDKDGEWQQVGGSARCNRCATGRVPANPGPRGGFTACVAEDEVV